MQKRRKDTHPNLPSDVLELFQETMIAMKEAFDAKSISIIIDDLYEYRYSEKGDN